ncbi:MAG TPA: hypothetical protein VNX23_22925 [Bradyrhizobium sp.]|jgi:hypothetical protein|nr:hypothetical protein [Bradyrhizobium sp.]
MLFEQNGFRMAANFSSPPNRNGAVASAAPSALTRGSALFDWQLAGATRSGTAGGETCTRSDDKDSTFNEGIFDLPQ